MSKKTRANKSIWTGRIISALCVLFLLVDAIMKVVKAAPSVEGSVKLQWPAEMVQGIGTVLLIATILYSIPRTALLGAIFVSCYLGGAVAVMARVHEPYYFPIVFGVLVWIGLFLRDPALHTVFPLRREEA
ncbi:DoxX family protein [Chitinophaga sp. MM2321]|uniref:DoxX family protein n=1 Tax=Chitinophaga sp. MM2321 TaxID=3137178 RepID=UPI0032D57750